MFIILVVFLAQPESIAGLCPQQSNATISTFLVLSTDAYQSSEKTAVHEVCKLYLSPGSSSGFTVSITHFFLFSHRQPKNTKEIVVKNKNDRMVLRTDTKAYKYFEGPVEVHMPMNLNFRALLVFTASKDCSQRDSFACSSIPSVCVSRDYLCDENDNCGEEVNCSETKKVTPLTSFEYDRDALSSSQMMLIGFFLLNLSFIVFFLTLSLCSAGYCYSSRFYLTQNRKSRQTFAKYIRDASKEMSKTTTPVPLPALERQTSPPIRKTSGEKRHRPSILSRLNFEPAASLKEQEPEAEDQASTSPMRELCAPPVHRHELFLRRQTLPALYNAAQVTEKKTTWKRASVGGGKIM